MVFYQLFKYFKDNEHRRAGNSGHKSKRCAIQATNFKGTVRIVQTGMTVVSLDTG